MSKRRQGPINKRLDFISNKLNKYSIRKFTVGTASILVGATLIFGHADNEAKAAEENHMENTSLNSIENDNDKNNQKLTHLMKLLQHQQKMCHQVKKIQKM